MRIARAYAGFSWATRTKGPIRDLSAMHGAIYKMHSSTPGYPYHGLALLLTSALAGACAAKSPATPEPGAATAGGAPSSAAAPTTAEEFVRRLEETVWGVDWEGKRCEPEKLERVRFSEDRKVMTVQLAQPAEMYDGTMATEWTYDVTEITPDHAHMKLRGEKRTTPSGELVEWDLRLSPEYFCWRGTDKPRMCVGVRVPCSEAAKM